MWLPVKWHCTLVRVCTVYTDSTSRRQQFHEAKYQPCSNQTALSVHYFSGYEITRYKKKILLFFNIKKKGYSHSLRITCDMNTVNLLESSEYRYIKAINNNNNSSYLKPVLQKKSNNKSNAEKKKDTTNIAANNNHINKKQGSKGVRTEIRELSFNKWILLLLALFAEMETLQTGQTNKEATKDRQTDTVSHWILTSCQPQRVSLRTNGQI